MARKPHYRNRRQQSPSPAHRRRWVAVLFLLLRRGAAWLRQGQAACRRLGLLVARVSSMFATSSWWPRPRHPSCSPAQMVKSCPEKRKNQAGHHKKEAIAPEKRKNQTWYHKKPATASATPEPAAPQPPDNPPSPRLIVDGTLVPKDVIAGFTRYCKDASACTENMRICHMCFFTQQRAALGKCKHSE